MTTGWDDLELSIAREFMNLEEFRIHGFLLGERKRGIRPSHMVTFTHLLIFSFVFRGI